MANIAPSISSKSDVNIFDALTNEGNIGGNEDLYKNCRSQNGKQRNYENSKTGTKKNEPNLENLIQMEKLQEELISKTNFPPNSKIDSLSQNLLKASNSEKNYHSQDSKKESNSEEDPQSKYSKNEQNSDKVDKNLIFCLTNKEPYCIIFLDNLNLFFECDCTFLNNTTTAEHKNEIEKKRLLEENQKRTKDERDDKYKFYCKKHPNRTKFEYYCTDCKYDLCEDCLKEDSKLYSNTKKTYKTHENHTLIKLDKIIPEFQTIDETIVKYDNLNKIGKYDEEQMKKIKYIFLIIKALIQFYNDYKCFNFYISIKNAEKFLEKIKDNFKFHEDKSIKFEHKIKITSEEALYANKDFIKDILSINIEHSKNSLNLELFKNIEFPILEELILVGDKIKDISPIFSCKYPKLKKLHLEDNQIDNNIIEYLNNAKLDELTFLSLYVNKITSLEIFDVIKNFKKLTSFHIGENKFDFKKDSKKKYEFPENIEEFGMTGNFNGDNTEFIEKLLIGNLQTLYLSRNKLKSFECLKNIQFTRLYKFWGISNEITDIKEIENINNKDFLEIINLKDNKINNFNELIKIIKDFPKLKFLDVSYNDIKEEDVLEMINRIKKEYKRDINILIEKNDNNID